MNPPLTKEKQKPYETIVHMFTIFFYVLMSLGLKEILMSDSLKREGQQWPCFIAALFLLLRFLFGSSSHLHAEHADEGDYKKAVWFFSWHLIWLIVLAGFATWICQSEDVSEFLFRNFIFGCIAATASFLDVAVEEEEEKKKGWCDRWSATWLLCNSIHAVASGGFWYKPAGGQFSIYGWNGLLICLVVVLFALLIFDFTFQIRRLHQAATMETASSKFDPPR